MNCDEIICDEMKNDVMINNEMMGQPEKRDNTAAGKILICALTYSSQMTTRALLRYITIHD